VFEVLRGPYSARLFISSLVARTPSSALGLIFVLRTRELTGSFAAAGLASGTQALVSALCSPALGRAIDRRGQFGVVVGASSLSAAAMVAFALLGPGAPLVAILACAAVAGGLLPPLGACLRTVWQELLGSEERVHAAFALESAFLEATYIAGPVLIAGAIGAWSTAASALTAAVIQAGGTLVFALTPPARAWRPSGAAAVTGAGAMRAGGVRTLFGIFALVGAAFGAVEVAVPAASAAAGEPHVAGLLLGVWGLGSLLGGLLAARAPAPTDRVRRLCLLLAALACGHALLAVPTGLVALGALLLLAGSAVAPSFGLAFGMVDGVAPPGAVTEAYTWLSTGIAFGLAPGSALGGALAQHSGAGAAFLVAAGAGAAAAALAISRRRTLAPVAAPA
jgi:predicted MFS family arabinose efflux permease